MITAVGIVKNESPRVEKWIASLRGIADAAVIADTGSTDDTVDRLHVALSSLGIDYVIAHHVWVDFATNRNLTLEIARRRFGTEGWIFSAASAGETYSGDVNDISPSWGRNAVITIPYALGEMLIPQARLFRADLDAKYECPTHETLVYPASATVAHSTAIRIDHDLDGRDDPGRFLRDIALLEPYCEVRPDDARAWFYLAQSWRDFGVTSEKSPFINTSEPLREAYLIYERVMNLPAVGEFRKDLRYLAALNRARIAETLGFVDVESQYLTAYAYRPHRAEALFYLIKHCRDNAKAAPPGAAAEWLQKIPHPGDSMVELWTYPKWEARS